MLWNNETTAFPYPTRLAKGDGASYSDDPIVSPTQHSQELEDSLARLEIASLGNDKIPLRNVTDCNDEDCLCRCVRTREFNKGGNLVGERVIRFDVGSKVEGTLVVDWSK